MTAPKAVRLLTDHFLWKLLSLVMATMLWIAVVDEPELTTNVTVPVEFRNLAAGLDLGSDVPDRVVRSFAARAAAFPSPPAHVQPSCWT